MCIRTQAEMIIGSIKLLIVPIILIIINLLSNRYLKFYKKQKLLWIIISVIIGILLVFVLSVRIFFVKCA